MLRFGIGGQLQIPSSRAVTPLHWKLFEEAGTKPAWCMLCLCENVAHWWAQNRWHSYTAGYVQKGPTHTLICKRIHTKTSTHFPPHSKTNTLSLHYTCTLYLPRLLCQSISLSFIFSTLLHSTLSFYLSTVCSYLSLHRSPSQSSPAKSLCPFIIHGVVLMAQAAMSDVNLCTSKAHSACTASARRVSAPAPVFRYHTALNQHAQSHLGHTAHANARLLFKARRSVPPFLNVNLVCFYAAKKRAEQIFNITISQPLVELHWDGWVVSFLPHKTKFLFYYNSDRFRWIEDKDLGLRVIPFCDDWSFKLFLLYVPCFT